MEAGVVFEADAGSLPGVVGFLFVLSARIATLHHHTQSVKPAMLDAKEGGKSLLMLEHRLHRTHAHAVCQRHNAAPPHIAL